MPLSLSGTTGIVTGNIAALNVTNDKLAIGAARLNFGAGAVLQVLGGSSTTPVTVSSTTYTDTGLTVSITPSSTSNKILVQASLNANFAKTASTQGVLCKLLRDSTALITPSAKGQGLVGVGGSSSLDIVHTIPFLYLDSPSSTSSLTYKIQGIPFSAASVTFNNTYSSIVVMEIAG